MRSSYRQHCIRAWTPRTRMTHSSQAWHQLSRAPELHLDPVCEHSAHVAEPRIAALCAEFASRDVWATEDAAAVPAQPSESGVFGDEFRHGHAMSAPAAGCSAAASVSATASMGLGFRSATRKMTGRIDEDAFPTSTAWRMGSVEIACEYSSPM